MKRQTIDIPKHPGETIEYEMDFSTALASGDSVTGSGTVYVYDQATGTDMSSTMISGSASTSGNTVSAFVTGGTNGKKYDIKYTASTTGGETLIEILVLMVKS